MKLKPKIKRPSCLVASFLVACALSCNVYADQGSEALEQLKSIRDGRDNSDMIRHLRVAPGGSVSLPAGAIGSGAVSNGSIANIDLAVNQRNAFVTVTPLTATWTSATPAAVTIQVADSQGNAHTGRVFVSIWTSAASFGVPSATSTGVTTFATGTIIQTGTVNRVLSDTSGLAVWTLGTAATGQVYVIGAVGDSVSSAAINLQ